MHDRNFVIENLSSWQRRAISSNHLVHQNVQSSRILKQRAAQ
jgi:hypothetical protein